MPLEREVWFYLITGLAVGGLAWGLQNTRRVIEAPFLYSLGMLLFLVPQLYVAAAYPEKTFDVAFNIYALMVVLCSVALFLGYSDFWKSAGSARAPRYRYVIDADRLFLLGLSVSAGGLLGTVMLGDELEASGEWSSWATYWYTLAKLTLPGVTVIMVAYAAQPKTVRLLAALFFSLGPLAAAFTAGRRSATLMLPLAFLLPFVLQRPAFRIPRTAVVAAVLFAGIVVYAFPVWRGYFHEGRYLEAMTLHPLDSIFVNVLEGKVTLETIDSINLMGAYYELGNYDWGYSRIYNSLIQNYVPGSLIGRDVKENLFIGDGHDHAFRFDWVEELYGVKVAYYTGKSSYSEVFGSFSFLGVIVFFGIGLVFRRLHNAALHRQDGRAIVALCFFVTLPATLPWAQVMFGLTLSVPHFLIIWMASRWCVVRIPVNGALSARQKAVSRRMSAAR